MLAKTNEERLTEILTSCMEELFSEQSVRVSRLASDYRPPSSSESLAAFSGFGSSAFRGSLILLGSLSLFSRMHPLPMNVVPRDLADWACELVNQAVGRYRNRLLAYDVSLTIGAPQSALAQNVRPFVSRRSNRQPICFAAESDILAVWLELAINPNFRLPDKPTHERSVALREGSALFF